MKREILRLGHPLLRLQAESLKKAQLLSSELQEFIDDMIETMHAARGAGLAAPQVGRSLRICVAEVVANERYPEMPSLPRRVWVNPTLRVLADGPEVSMYEGCLSVPGLRGRVRRPAHVEVVSWDREGHEQRDEFRGALAAVAGHELDHLDGVLFVDRADSRTLCFADEYQENVPPEERIQVLGLGS